MFVKSNQTPMRYYMFIDESGEANITKPDPRFNIFVLCGVVFREDSYFEFDASIKELKRKFWGDGKIIFHSVEMRSKKGIFKIFQDQEVLREFYVDIGNILKNSGYTVLSCIINKEKYKEQYPDKNHAYEDSLTFMCERGISLVGRQAGKGKLHVCLEKRQNQKDSQLKKFYSNFIKYGTEYVSTYSFQLYHPKLHFRGKEEDVSGLQLADLCAYPIARKFLSPQTPQPTFDIFEHKILRGPFSSYKGWGIKHFP